MCNQKRKEAFRALHRARYDDPEKPFSRIVVDHDLCQCDELRINAFFEEWQSREYMEFNTYRVPVVETFVRLTNLPTALLNSLMRAYFLEGKYQEVCMMYKMAYIVGHGGQCAAELVDIADSDYSINHLLPAFQRYGQYLDQTCLFGECPVSYLGKSEHRPSTLSAIGLVRSTGSKLPWLGFERS